MDLRFLCKDEHRTNGGEKYLDLLSRTARGNSDRLKTVFKLLFYYSAARTARQTDKQTDRQTDKITSNRWFPNKQIQFSRVDYWSQYSCLSKPSFLCLGPNA